MSRYLLLWDAPNMDMALTDVIGGKPRFDTRPNFAAIARWLCHQATPDGVVEACLFTNVAAENAPRMLPWVMALRKAGFAVFAKPKLKPDDDIDDALTAHLRERYERGDLELVALASHDGRGFAPALSKMTSYGIRTVVLGFAERTTAALHEASTSFVDLEDIAGVFTQPLPRTNLASLPEGGKWFSPLTELHPAAATVDEDTVVDLDLTAEDHAGPTRDEVVRTVHDIVHATADDLDLGALGARVKQRLPGFSTVALGYVKLHMLVEDLADDAEVEVVWRADGHPSVRRCEHVDDESRV